jgi:hypothetical protein
MKEANYEISPPYAMPYWDLSQPIESNEADSIYGVFIFDFSFGRFSGLG